MAADGVRLGHVNIEVTDLARARGFYDKLLPALGFRRLASTDSAWLGYRKGKLTIWMTVSRPRQAVRRPPRVPTTGTTDPISDHLGFWIPSFQALSRLERRLLGKGLKPVYRIEKVPTEGGTWYVSDAWRDPDNNILELYTVLPR